MKTVLKALIMFVMLASSAIITLDFIIVWNHAENVQAVNHALISMISGFVTLYFGDKTITRIDSEE